MEYEHHLCSNNHIFKNKTSVRVRNQNDSRRERLGDENTTLDTDFFVSLEEEHTANRSDSGSQRNHNIPQFYLLTTCQALLTSALGIKTAIKNPTQRMLCTLLLIAYLVINKVVWEEIENSKQCHLKYCVLFSYEYRKGGEEHAHLFFTFLMYLLY